MQYDEITKRERGEELVFARTGRRSWYMGEDEIADKAPLQATTHVQQYKFIRLRKRANYEPLILCLKGLQLAFNPGDYLTAEQLRFNPELRQQYEQLKQWASAPEKIADKTIDEFLRTVRQGLMKERHAGPAHKLHYINWAISALKRQLRMFNQRIQQAKS